MARHVWFSLLVFSAVGVSAVEAQGRGHLSGVVRDNYGKPIAAVEVTAIKHAVTTRTDSMGRFMLASLPAGELDLSFRRLAFEAAIVSTELEADDTTKVEVTLTVVAQRLTGVLTLARPETRRELLAFEMRRRAGIGHYVTRRQINERHPLRLSDMMRTIPGVFLLPGVNGRETLRFSAVARASCPPMFYIDGILAIGFNIDEIPPGDVEGVELYGGAAGVPPEYSRSRGTSTCGTVLIWTRKPGV